jgi:hypothetical protein
MSSENSREISSLNKVDPIATTCENKNTAAMFAKADAKYTKCYCEGTFRRSKSSHAGKENAWHFIRNALGSLGEDARNHQLYAVFISNPQQRVLLRHHGGDRGFVIWVGFPQVD